VCWLTFISPFTDKLCHLLNPHWKWELCVLVMIDEADSLQYGHMLAWNMSKRSRYAYWGWHVLVTSWAAPAPSSGSGPHQSPTFHWVLHIVFVLRAEGKWSCSFHFSQNCGHKFLQHRLKPATSAHSPRSLGTDLECSMIMITSSWTAVPCALLTRTCSYVSLSRIRQLLALNSGPDRSISRLFVYNSSYSHNAPVCWNGLILFPLICLQNHHYQPFYRTTVVGTVLYVFTLSAFPVSGPYSVGWAGGMNDEFERIWKESSCRIEVFNGIHLGEVRSTMNTTNQDSRRPSRDWNLVSPKHKITGRGGPWGCETSRLPRFLDNRVTDGGKVVILRAGRHLPTGRFLVPISVRGWVDSRPIVPLEGLGQLKKFHLIGTRSLSWSNLCLACNKQ
jgi:hypothetical protein